MSSTNPTFALRKKLPANPLGNVLFSLGMVAKVPYFGTVLPLVQEMEPGYCKVTAPNWFGVHNHIGTFHAIAACNLAEAAMGMLMVSPMVISLPFKLLLFVAVDGWSRLTHGLVMSYVPGA